LLFIALNRVAPHTGAGLSGTAPVKYFWLCLEQNKAGVYLPQFFPFTPGQYCPFLLSQPSLLPDFKVHL